VTLWRPFWANAAFPIKDLEDPKGAMGETESLHFLGTLGFSDEFPEAAEYISNIKLDDDAYGALESLVTGDEFADDPEGAVDAWIADNADAYPGILTD
ncbi:MAG: glycine betaine ABC transporter substrate-binding protein, partial [Leucobacter sp.]